MAQSPGVDSQIPDLWVDAIIDESCRLFEAGMMAISWGDRQEGFALLDAAVLVILEQDDSMRQRDPVQQHLSFLIETIHDTTLMDAAFHEAPEEVYDSATLERLLAGSLSEDLIAHIDEDTTAEEITEKTDFPMVHNAAVDRLMYLFTHDKAPLVAQFYEFLLVLW